MNQAEKKVYQRLRKVPAKLREPSAWEPIRRASKKRFEAEKDAIASRNTQTARVYDALRSLVQGSPQADALRAALPSLPQKRVNTTIPKLAPIPAPKSAKLRLDPIQLIDIAPFVTETWWDATGPNNITVAADPSGNLNVFTDAGYDPQQGATGNGHASCWAAAGQDYTPPAEGMLRFSASPSFSWRTRWGSTFWRQAAGQVWIGQLIIRFDQNGVIIDAPVQTQNILYSFDDRNLDDRGDQSGSATGLLLQSQLIVDPSFVHRCFVWIGGSANADRSNNQSWANISLAVSFSSITLELF